MSSLSKQPIGGKVISKEEAFKDLGDPKTWDKFKKKMSKKFKKKPHGKTT